MTFQYEPGAPVVKGLSFFCPGGKTVAFVGATGSGKSTLTRLLFRWVLACLLRARVYACLCALACVNVNVATCLCAYCACSRDDEGGGGGGV